MVAIDVEIIFAVISCSIVRWQMEPSHSRQRTGPDAKAAVSGIEGGE
jgi:hypothetical protein